MTIAVLDRPAAVPAPSPALRRHRAAIAVAFLIAGTAIGTWTARMPEIQHHLHLSDGHLSVALLALAAGGLAGMRFTGRIVDRYGAAAVIRPTALLVGAALAV